MPSLLTVEPGGAERLVGAVLIWCAFNSTEPLAIELFEWCSTGCSSESRRLTLDCLASEASVAGQANTGSKNLLRIDYGKL